MPNFAPVHGRFLFSNVAAMRAKQLARGAMPRLTPFSPLSPPTRVAQEEVIRGLIPFHLPSAATRLDGVALAGHDAELAGTGVTVHGGASAVIANPDAVMALHAASLQGTVWDLYRALAERDTAFFDWTAWEGDREPAAVLRPRSDDLDDRQHASLLRTALSVLRSTWLAHDGDRDDLVMTLTVNEFLDSQLHLESTTPTLIAHPGTLTLTIAGKLLKPLSWAATLGLRGGLSRSIPARQLRERLRARASRRGGDIEHLREISEVDAEAVKAASGIVVFIHGLLSTDIGTFDAVIDRVRMLAPDALRIGFPHNTLTSIEANAQELALWLTTALEFDHKTGAVRLERPIVFVCHSRGGLVARSTAAQLFEVSAAWRTLIRGAVTFGTPHKGAALAEAPEQMAAVIAVVSALHGARSMMGLADVLGYCRNGGTFEGIRDLQPVEGAKDSTVSFLKNLQANELKFGTLERLAFGGSAPADTVVSRIIGRALGGAEHDHVVERSSSMPDSLTGVATRCNHFGYFENGGPNTTNLDRAARQVVAWLA